MGLLVLAMAVLAASAFAQGTGTNVTLTAPWSGPTLTADCNADAERGLIFSYRDVEFVCVGSNWYPTVEAYLGRDGKFQLPDRKITPGVVNPRLLADLSGDKHMIQVKGHLVETNICARDFRTPPFRQATKDESIKKKVCVAYGITKGCPGPDYELDDLLPIEDGGENIQQNLWPQKIVEARIKDHQVEDIMPKLICAGKISLKDAQSCIVNDWVACRQRLSVIK